MSRKLFVLLADARTSPCVHRGAIASDFAPMHREPHLRGYYDPRFQVRS